MGYLTVLAPIPIPTLPLKGRDLGRRFFYCCLYTRCKPAMSIFVCSMACMRAAMTPNNSMFANLGCRRAPYKTLPRYVHPDPHTHGCT